MCVDEKEREKAPAEAENPICQFPLTFSLSTLSLPLSTPCLPPSLQFASFNDTLVSLAGDDGIPFATSHEASTGEECAALCASVTVKATAAAAKKVKKGDSSSSAPPLPRCFSAAFDVKEKDDEKGGAKTFACALYGWPPGDPCPEVTVETSGGTTSFLDPKALSASLGACAAASSSATSAVPSSGPPASASPASAPSASSASASYASSSSSRATKSKQKTAAASSSLTLPADTNEEKAEALSAIADAVRSSLPPAPPDPTAAASAASAAAAALASAAAGGDDTAARAQAWAAVVDAKPGAAVAVVGARPPISAKSFRNAKNLTLSFEYLGTVTDVASAAVCSGLCQEFVAGADNAGGEILGVTEFGQHTLSGKAGYELFFRFFFFFFLFSPDEKKEKRKLTLTSPFKTLKKTQDQSYYGVSDGPLQAHCVAASFYDGDAALGIDAKKDPGQSVGHVCDLFGVAPRGATVLLLEPTVLLPEGRGGELARSTVTFIRPQRWSELDYALED